MKAKYETLDEYLDDLDAIKERIARETQGMTAKQVEAYFAKAVRELEAVIGERLRLRRAGRKASPAKR